MLEFNWQRLAFHLGLVLEFLAIKQFDNLNVFERIHLDNMQDRLDEYQDSLQPMEMSNYAI